MQQVLTLWVPAIAIAMAASAPAWAINKCTGPDGKVVYQDAPCAGAGGAIDVRPASGRAPQPQASPADPVGSTPAHEPDAAAAEPRTEAQRLNAIVSSSQANRRRIELETALVPNARATMAQARAQCDAEMAAVRAQKSRARNNLAGATWETSLSQEMQAIATRCESQQQDLRGDLEALRYECRDLGGCKGF